MTPRPALSIIINSPPDNFVNNYRAFEPSIESIHSSPAKRTRRVRFEATGTLPVVRADLLALLLAEKHETKPSTLKMTKFSETLDLLKSASAWDKFSLTRFGVKFERTEYTDLSTLIKDQRWYDPETETATKGFVNRLLALTRG